MSRRIIVNTGQMAYRLRSGCELWTVLRDIRQRARERAREALEALYNELLTAFEDREFRARAVEQMTMLEPPHLAEEVRRKLLVRAKRKWGLAEVAQYCRVMHGLTNMRGTPGPYDFDLSLSVWQLDGFNYVIPSGWTGPLGNCLKFLDTHPDLEDYHYGTVQIRPSNVAVVEWAARQRVWMRLLAPDREHDHLTFDIVSFKSFSCVDPQRKKGR